MKIQFDKKAIESALQKTFRAVSPRSPLPILGYVLIKTLDEGKVSFSTTDLEFGIECKIEAVILEEGSVCVPARIITELVGQIREDKIVIETVEEGRLELSTAKSKYHINTRDVDEFPIFPKPSAMPLFSIPQTTFKEMIRNVIISVATLEEQRATLTGVFLQADENGFVAVSTDSRRLSKVYEPIDEPPEREFSVIVPQRSMKEIMSLLSENETTVSFTFSEGQLFLNFDGVMIFSRIIDGKFPSYQAVIPRSSSIKVLVEKSRLQTAIRRALIMAMDKDTPDLLRTEITPNSIRITANSIDVGDAWEEVFIQEMEGDSIEIALNGKYMNDVLGVISDDFVWIYVNTPVMPVMIKSPQKENYIFIVMPVRLVREEKREDYGDASVHSYT